LSLRPVDKNTTEVWVVQKGDSHHRSDAVAIEEPLEIRLVAHGIAPRKDSLGVVNRADASPRTLAITMRTPGADLELAAGFLHGEGVIKRRDDIRAMAHATDKDLDEARRLNIVTVELRSGVFPDLRGLDRHFYTTSACGVCGKASIEALRVQGCASIPPGPVVDPAVLDGLPHKLHGAQQVFAATGGLHAAALFDEHGRMLAAREDVGRHNAVDKLVGAALLEGWLPLSRHIVMVSGRSSFEIVQKCVVAGAPILCAVSAPSSLAVALAQEFGMTLIGFLRDERFNVYAGLERLNLGASARP